MYNESAYKYLLKTKEYKGFIKDRVISVCVLISAFIIITSVFIPHWLNDPVLNSANVLMWTCISFLLSYTFVAVTDVLTVPSICCFVKVQNTFYDSKGRDFSEGYRVVDPEHKEYFATPFAEYFPSSADKFTTGDKAILFSTRTVNYIIKIFEYQENNK